MHLPATLESVPLALAEQGGAIRVGGTRLTLDTVIGAYRRGATPEEIVQDFPAVSLPDVYAVLAHYLRHRAEVDDYLERRVREHAELRREIEASAGHREFRERLRARSRYARAGVSLGYTGTGGA